jgi:RimJ/RimL family protein N-acetyltransferase
VPGAQGGETAMIEFEPGGRGVEPLKAAFGGQPPGSMRRVPAEQFYHFQWHQLRVQRGPISGTFLPTVGAHPGIPARVVIGFFVGLHMRGAAELRAFLPSPGGHQARITKAQVALSVESAWQGRGIGTALMAETLRTARERGIDQLHLTCHALNRRMQRIAERFGATIGFEGCECFAEITLRDEALAMES